ncbi:hypothetical protein BVI2075_180191 [Burkholderia vietnamiensis]|nr:hypothetical protein BVI2075_180191 [Burkholderia vietnamiensis]
MHERRAVDSGVTTRARPARAYYGRNGKGGYHRPAGARYTRHSNRVQRLPIRGADGD